MLILISDAFAADLPDRLAPLGEVTDDKSRVADAEVVLIRSKTKATREYIDGAPKLKYIIRGGVGLDNVDLVYAKEKGVRVENTADASSIAVAELAMTLMLGAINHVAVAHQGMAQGKFLKKELKRTELYKKTLGLIGIGRIGSAVAKRCKAFGMTVIAYDAYVKESDIAELQPSLEDLVAKADILSLHTPLTDETRGILNTEILAKTKKGVVVVNTARGLVVDEAAMAEALKAGQVACYATDVWSSDPPPAECPILGAPHTLMTPHIGASTAENMGRIGDIVVEKLTAYVKEG
ncbi:MAG: hydroxyacid dehydrogenase [Deltaproteobacteria bacterium]|nr:hydroxyacid dehydrogenase [Deltaproteobacteria bacterium]